MNGSSMTSFMDVIACGLGAAILLFLLGASAQKGMSAGDADSSTIVIRCALISGSPGSVGIEFQSPSRPVWTLADSYLQNQDGYVFAASSKDEPTMISLALLFAPEKGTWKFRPVMLDDAGKTAGNADSVIELSVAGKQVRNREKNPCRSVLKQVARPGGETVIDILGAGER